MKKLCMLLMLVLAMTSHLALAQEITITLNLGWNWISYSQTESMSINDALGDFVPMNGDSTLGRRQVRTAMPRHK